MRDIMIKNGDTVINSSGSTVLLEGLDAKFQQAVICISAKLGGFVYDRELGSTVALQSKTLSAKQLELLANESLAEMENAFASIKNVGRKITIDLTVDGITHLLQDPDILQIHQCHICFHNCQHIYDLRAFFHIDHI